MSKTETAISLMEQWANDDSHGYDQQYRWGERGDYDCSSAVISAWETAGVPVKQNGATYTGNMYTVFVRTGFKDVTDSVYMSDGTGLKRGDVLLNHENHVAMYCGDGYEVEASMNEFGGVVGGQPGDQTGFEFLIQPYRNYPWDCVLRWPEEVKYMFEVSQIQYGDIGDDVRLMQSILRGRGYIDRDTGELPAIDGSFGDMTLRCLLYFQEIQNLEKDGICGPATWTKLLRR